MQPTLSSTFILSIVGAYFLMLIAVAWRTGRSAKDDDFFLAGRKSPWYLVAFGMIGASLSGVTFISIPGAVGGGKLNMGFSYMQVVFGYMVGYAVIALVLMPLYYRLRLTSIYTYLEQRFGVASYKTGAFFFLLSRSIGASFRLFLVAIVMQQFVMNAFGIPFWATVLVTIFLIWIYTFQGGIKTIVWTDTLQTAFMLIAVIVTIISIGKSLHLNGIGDIAKAISQSEYGKMFFFDGGWNDPNNFFKQFLGGAAIAVVMTGLDQDMMQKNLSCRNIQEAQKNMFWFSIVLIFTNLLFLTLGALLYLYAGAEGIEIPKRTDLLYPTLAFEYLSPAIAITFVIGLIAAAYSSADSALTALTTSFCIDFLNFEKKQNHHPHTRLLVHIGFSLLFFGLILLFWYINDESVINKLFKIAGYTYGPLLGLFTFGMLTKAPIRDHLAPVVCIAAPVTTYIINANSVAWLGGYEFGFELLILNGLLTFIGLALIQQKNTAQ